MQCPPLKDNNSIAFFKQEYQKHLSRIQENVQDYLETNTMVTVHYFSLVTYTVCKYKSVYLFCGIIFVKLDCIAVIAVLFTEFLYIFGNLPFKS